MSGSVCVESERWQRIVSRSHQLDQTIADWQTDTSTLQSDLAACRTSLTNIATDSTALNSELAALHEKPQQVSEAVAAAVTAQQSEGAAISSLGNSLDRSSQTLAKATAPPDDEWDWLAPVLGGVVCLGGILIDDLLQSSPVATASGCGAGAGLTIGALVW